MRTSARINSCVAVTAVAIVAALGGAGCSSGSGSSTPTSNDYDDVAQSTAAIVATPGGGGEVTSMYDVATISVGTTPSGATVTASGSFSSVHAGVTYSYTVSCTDAHGNALAQCGPTTNDAQASVSWSGTLSVPDYTATVNRTGNWSVTGIQTGTATFNGTGSFNYSSHFESAFRDEQASANLTYGATYDAVVYDEATGLVNGGTVDYTINASGMASSTSGSASGTFTIDAVVTFAPGGTATIVLDGSHTYTVTASGVVTKV
jgi:hypothetical protein